MAISAEQWSRIRELFGDWSHTSGSPGRGIPYCALATVNQDGSPHLTPIGTLFLDEEPRGFYFEQYSRHMSQNLERDPRICVLVVNTSMSLWGHAVATGRLRRLPALRLRGTVGKRRKATPTEIGTLRKPTRIFQAFKGYSAFWGNLRQVREIQFEAFEPIELGPLTQELSDTIDPVGQAVND